MINATSNSPIVAFLSASRYPFLLRNVSLIISYNFANFTIAHYHLNDLICTITITREAYTTAGERIKFDYRDVSLEIYKTIARTIARRSIRHSRFFSHSFAHGTFTFD